MAFLIVVRYPDCERAFAWIGYLKEFAASGFRHIRLASVYELPAWQVHHFFD
jgi:hypothetical protein